MGVLYIYIYVVVWRVRSQIDTITQNHIRFLLSNAGRSIYQIFKHTQRSPNNLTNDICLPPTIHPRSEAPVHAHTPTCSDGR